MRPPTVWLPFAAVLANPGPSTETDVAFEAAQVIVEEPGAVVAAGVAEIDAATDDGGAAT